MKYILIVFILTQSVLSCFGGGLSEKYRHIGKSADVSAIRAAIHETGKLWPSSINEYCIRMEWLMRGINDVVKSHPGLRDEAFTIANDVLRKDAFSLGRKTSRVLMAQDACIAMIISIEYQANAPTDRKILTAKIIALSYTKAKSNRLNGYVERQVFSSVPPPDGAVDKNGFFGLGMPPAAIVDEKLRQIYIESIEQNNRNIISNETQYILKTLLPSQEVRVIGYCNRLAISDAETSKRIDEILNMVHSKAIINE